MTTWRALLILAALASVFVGAWPARELNIRFMPPERDDRKAGGA